MISNDEDIDDYEAGHTSYDDYVHNDDGYMMTMVMMLF